MMGAIMTAVLSARMRKKQLRACITAQRVLMHNQERAAAMATVSMKYMGRICQPVEYREVAHLEFWPVMHCKTTVPTVIPNREDQQ